MPTTPILNFSKGELGPQLYGRIDASQYAAAGKRMRNVIAQRYGGAAARPGFRLIGKLDDQDQPVKLVPFQFSIDQAYVIGMQQAKARLLAFGGFVLEQNTKITAISQASAAVVIAPFHGLAVGDRVFFSGITGMVEVNGRQGTVQSVSGTDGFTVDIDTRSFGAFTGSDGTSNVAPPPAPTPTPSPAPTPTPTPPPETGGGGGSGGDIRGGGGRFDQYQQEL